MRRPKRRKSGPNLPTLIGGLVMIAAGSLSLLTPGFILSMVLLVLRLTENTTLSWWWITAGVWGPICLGVGLAVLYGCLVAAFELYVRWSDDEDDGGR